MRLLLVFWFSHVVCNPGSFNVYDVDINQMWVHIVEGVCYGLKKRASGSVATTSAGQPQRDLVDEELLGFKEVQSAGGTLTTSEGKPC